MQNSSVRHRGSRAVGPKPLCNSDIYRELSAIGRSYPEALMQHSQDVTDQVDTLADLLCETAKQIGAEADALQDVASRQKGAANDVP